VLVPSWHWYWHCVAGDSSDGFFLDLLQVFFYEILKIPDKAAHVAKDAFDAAIADLESVPVSSGGGVADMLRLLGCCGWSRADENPCLPQAHHYRDTTLLLQLLRDNLALWTDGAEYDISDVPALK